MEILRKKEIALLRQKLQVTPVVAILGPRQCGKTTLAHQFARQHGHNKVHFFDLENPRDLASLVNPMLTLEDLRGLVVIDEIQRRPELFPILRVLADRRLPVHYLILGSASRDLIAQGSESLAGRLSFMELGGFSLETVGTSSWKPLWLRGGFPRSFLAKDSLESFEWRHEFIATFLERDIPNLGIQIPAQTLRRFWMMLAHYHGQLFNASELGRNLGMADTTVKRHLDILAGTFMVRQLQPWFTNTKKRLVKRPKIYFRDTGILHALLSITKEQDILGHPKLGASWEGFALEQTIQSLGLGEGEAFFWGIHSGAELDLLFQKNGKWWGIEFKYQEAPTLTRSMATALQELELSHLWVVYPGNKNYALEKKVSVISLSDLDSLCHFS